MWNKKLFLGIAATAAALWSGCEEKTIVIPDLQVGDRKVLVEELTGVRCQNCPDGAADLQDLSQTLGDNLIVVALHAAAGYDQPFSDSKYDFRTEDGRAITDYIYVNGDPGAPAAAIDRQLLDGQTDIFINRPWKGAINARAAVQPELGLFLTKNYNAATRALDITANIAPDAPLTGDLRLTVVITEDSIIDVQQKGTQKIINYMHRHVFRDAVTAPTGDNISAALAIGSPFSKSYSVTLPENWVAEHCAVVAYVHRHGTPDSKAVLQAEEIHIKD